jgi:hypothetical protein
MVWPLRSAEWMEGLWRNHFLHMFVAVDVNPDGWTTVFHHIYKSWGVAGFMWGESFHILAWMCFLWRSLVLEVDVNLYGLTTSMCMVDGRSVTCTTICILSDCSGCKTWWLNHWFRPHLQELRCGWFFVIWVLHILAWMCMLTCVGSGRYPICVDHFDAQSWVQGLCSVLLSALCLAAVE